MTSVFDNEESLTREEILRRFEKIMGRHMTAEEKDRFFLPPEIRAESNPAD